MTGFKGATNYIILASGKIYHDEQITDSKKHINAFDISHYEHRSCSNKYESISRTSLNSQSVPLHSLVRRINHQNMKTITLLLK